VDVEPPVDVEQQGHHWLRIPAPSMSGGRAHVSTRAPLTAHRSATHQSTAHQSTAHQVAERITGDITIIDDIFHTPSAKG
jgi:hypothetical protein